MGCKFMGYEKVVGKTRELEKVNKIDVETYMEDRRRYAKDLVEDTTGLPSEFFDLDLVSANQVLYFLDRDYISPYTGKRTFNNLIESYIVSGSYTTAHLNSVFEKEEKELHNMNGDFIGIETIYHRDEDEYKKIELAAMQNWRMKNLDNYIRAMFEDKLGGIPLEDLVKMEVVTNALYHENDVRKAQYMRMAIDILGLKDKADVIVQNVWKKGGEERVKAIADNTDMDFLK